MTATAAPSFWRRGEDEVSLARLYLMRAIAIFFVAQGIFNIWPNILVPDTTARGMITSVLGGLWVMALIGIRYPLKILPIYLFEFAWKTLWLLAFGLPQWLSGAGSPRLGEDLVEIGAFSLVFALIIPWGYVWRHYVQAPGDRWT